MAKLDASTRTIQVRNFDFHYSVDDFVNPDSISTSDSRMNRAWVIHTCGTVLAIVFAEYYAYCEQDALDEACDRDKLDSLRVSDAELADYKTGEDSEGFPEHEGIIHLGNASEPFDSQNLEIFEVAADLFKLDPAIMLVIEQQSRDEAAENLQSLAQTLINDDSVDVEGYRQVWRVIDYLREAEPPAPPTVNAIIEDQLSIAHEAGECGENCPHCDSPTFILGDQPTTCPKCGRRTDWIDNPDGSQAHTCPGCNFAFMAVSDAQ